eukprot:s202_g35.t1
MASSDDHKVNDPLQTQALSEDLQLRNDTLKVEVQMSHNELQKQKIARQLLEEKLRTLECQLLDSMAEKEEIQSLLEDLAAQTSACTKAQEQVQKALKDMELAGANGSVKAMEQLPTAENEVEEGIESTVQDMLELQQSNEAVKALLKTFCDDFRRQRAERDELEAKLRSVECQLSDATKQDELQALLQHFALHTAANLKAEAAIQAVLNDLEALKASKDLEVAIASFMGDAKAAVAEKAEKLLGQALPESLAPNSAGSEGAAAPVEVPRSVAARRYNLKEPHAFAQFLQDANIRLIRAKYLSDLARSKRPLPRRQEAESEVFEFDGNAESALVSHEEVQNWAEGARTATICSVSHAWETREHPDPCRYQLELIVDRAAWYEAAFETEVWIFYDFTSLFQYERLFSEEERSFRAAMDNMHIMYSHECTMTFMIEHLTPKDVWKSTMKNDQELIPVWDIEHKSSDKVEPDGQFLTGKVPLTPDSFRERMKDAKFTHRDKDLPLVVELQQKIFDEKVAVCEHLVLKGLPEQEMFALAGALPLYKSLTTLKLDSFECSEEAAEAFGKALATSQVVSLELVNPQPGSGAFMGKAVVDALTTNQFLTRINAEDESIFDLAAKKAVAKALRNNRSIKERLPFDAPVRLKALAEALERNSLTNITMDPEYDQIGDEEAKVVAQLVKITTSVKSIDLGDTCISDDGAQALAEALRCNQTLEELWLHKDQITDVGAEALAEALKVNKTLRSLTVAAPWEALKAVQNMKRDRGDDFQFISREDQKEAEWCNGDIFQAASNGKVGRLRGLRLDPAALCGDGRPCGGGAAAAEVQGPGGRERRRRPNSAALCSCRRPRGGGEAPGGGGVAGGARQGWKNSAGLGEREPRKRSRPAPRSRPSRCTTARGRMKIMKQLAGSHRTGHLISEHGKRFHGFTVSHFLGPATSTRTLPIWSFWSGIRANSFMIFCK